MHVAERLVRVLVCLTDYTVADLYLVKNFHLHKITDKRKKLLGLLVWSIIHLQVQHRWKDTLSLPGILPKLSARLQLQDWSDVLLVPCTKSTMSQTHEQLHKIT